MKKTALSIVLMLLAGAARAAVPFWLSPMPSTHTAYGTGYLSGLLKVYPSTGTAAASPAITLDGTSGGVAATSFTGSGAGLTALPAGELTGTVPTGSVDLSTVTTRFLAVEASTGVLTADLATEISNRGIADAAIAVSTGANASAISALRVSTGTIASDLAAEISRATARENDLGASTGTIKASLDGVILSTAPLKDYANWNTAYSWGDHAGLYLSAPATFYVVQQSDYLVAPASFTYVASETDPLSVKKAGDTMTGPLTLSGSSLTVTGDGSFGGSLSAANLSGTNTGDQTDITGNAATVTNGVYTTGSYANPSWITSLSTSKIDLSTVTTALAGKQATGDYITSLTGAVTASGPGAAAATIVSVPQSAVNLSTVTTALAGKLDTGGNAVTASALAADPTDCSGVNFARGVNASGAAACAQPSDVTGNSATATKLATARTINGVSFDGSANINIATTSYLADGVSLALTGATFSAKSSSVTLQGNTFNGASQLVKLDALSKLPAVDGSQLTNLPSTSGGAVLTATQTFTGANTFISSVTATGSIFSSFVPFAYARFSATDSTIATSINISSITVVTDPGQYRVNFTDAAPNTNYLAVCSAGNDVYNNLFFCQSGTRYTNGMNFGCFSWGGAAMAASSGCTRMEVVFYRIQ